MCGAFSVPTIESFSAAKETRLIPNEKKKKASPYYCINNENCKFRKIYFICIHAVLLVLPAR